MRIETHPGNPYDRSTLGLTETEWERLRRYVDSINEALSDDVTTGGGVEEVEEPPPRFTSEGFDPGGWVGMYPGEVTVVPRHLSQEEYEQMLGDTQAWIEVIGASTIAASLPLSTDILIDARARYAAYSEALIELTEMIQAHRLPVEVQRTRQTGIEPEGRPLFDATIQASARGSRHVVSEELTFSFDTLLNHLLVRFHIDLLGEMQELAQEYPYYRAAFEHQIAYHEGFVATGIPNQLVEQAINTDFTSPALIAEARRGATAHMAEVVDLWEAFQHQIGMEVTLSNNLNTAVKPVSKIYELWCLKTLLDSLEQVTGITPTTRDSIDKVYRFEDSLKLHYNRYLGHHSQYLNPNLGVTPGEPDFAIEVDGEIVWIGDAKFKTNVRGADYRRFLVYLVDLLTPEQVSTILYVGENPPDTTYIRDYPIEHFPLRPASYSKGRMQVIEHIQEILDV
jgi:hypothetical protein